MDEELKKYLTAMEERLTTRMDQRIEASEQRLVEKMRNMQSELLRGLRASSGAPVIRLRKLEVDQSNSDASLSDRLEIVETRLLEITERLVRAR